MSDYQHINTLLYSFLDYFPGIPEFFNFIKRSKKEKTPSVIHQILVISVPGDR
jgi:hypothetical protein